jgi:hypothetical protein
MKPSKLPTTPHRHTCMLLCLSTLRNIMHTSHHKTCHMHRGHGGISCISQSIPHIPHTCIRLIRIRHRIRIPYKAMPAHTKPHTSSPHQPQAQAYITPQDVPHAQGTWGHQLHISEHTKHASYPCAAHQNTL